MKTLLVRGRQWAVAQLAGGAASLFAWLPPDLALRTGAGLGRFASWLSPRRAQIALTNLRIAFPHWSEARRRRVMRESFANLGRGLVEAARLYRGSTSALLARTRVVGAEHVEQALARSRAGVVVVTAHLGNWELLGAAMAQRGVPITAVYRARDNPYLERLVRRWRDRSGMELIARGSAARGVLRALRAGRVLALHMDQNVRGSEGGFAPFFGRLACTRSGPVRLAMRTGSPVLPVFIQRVGTGPSHIIRIGAPLELVSRRDNPQGALAQNLRRVNRAIEQAIRAAPEQWTWNHRRWKTQPPGEPRTYRSKRAPGPLRAFLLRPVRLGFYAPFSSNVPEPTGTRRSR